jgi:YD repeat-containing protein
MYHVPYFPKGLVYYYYVPQGGYAPNGNILVHSDYIMGDWYFNYDAADRLVSATPDWAVPAQYQNKYGCWTYDAFGNRASESFSTTACNSSPPLTSWANYNSANNRFTTTSYATSGVTYDASGNLLYDGNNKYWYDAEGQLCAMQSLVGGPGAVTQYVYDAEGARIAKTTVSAAPSSTYATCAPPLGSGSTLTGRYLVDSGGNQVTELNGSGVWQHSNIWAGGTLTATYDTTPLHFTGKERDSESGNDSFETCYCSSAMGRFMSPNGRWPVGHPAGFRLLGRLRTNLAGRRCRIAALRTHGFCQNASHSGAGPVDA